MAHANHNETQQRPLRILIVEDMFIVADEIQFMLSTLGHQPLGPVCHLEDALYILESAEQPIDGALLDINLGEETGYPIAQELKQRDIPFIFMTGYDSSYLNEEFRNDPFLTKPFTRDELRRAVQRTFDGQYVKGK